MAAPGYISKFNMVLSISEVAINRQLKYLYDTPAPKPQTEYLIKYNLDIEVNVVDGELHGFIEPPKVSWADFNGSAA